MDHIDQSFFVALDDKEKQGRAVKREGCVDVISRVNCSNVA